MTVEPVTQSRKRKRRTRSPHPGVVLKRRTLPSGATVFRARFDDPDTGRETYVTLDAVALTTHEARRLWAIEKSKALAKRRMAIASGAPLNDSKPFEDAIEGYRTAAKNRLRERTMVTYGLALNAFEAWAKSAGVASTDKLTGPKLVELRNHLIALPLKKAKQGKGAKRGAMRTTTRKRSPVSVNRELRTLKTLLNDWRQKGLLPYLNRDAITDTLKPLPTAKTDPEYLPSAAIKKLLEATRQHDEQTFKETRGEHAGLGLKGTTKRHVPIAEFTAFLLLSGCRRGEALSLLWTDVDLNARDSEGRKVGEIRLKAARTKTHHDRTVGLEVSPALRNLLSAMKVRAKGVHIFADSEGNRYTEDVVKSARTRLMKLHGAPAFDWQVLRSSCATYLTNAPSIFGGAAAYHSSKQLGHSVTVAEEHYAGLIRGIPKKAKTLEAAMGIEATLAAMFDVKPKSK